MTCLGSSGLRVKRKASTRRDAALTQQMGFVFLKGKGKIGDTGMSNLHGSLGEIF